MKNFWRLVLFTIFTMSMFPAYAAPVPTCVEGICEHKFPNGFTALLFPDESKGTVTVNITYLVGSRHEGRGEAGMAHLLEHMLFKGSKKFPNVDVEMQRRGATFNGTTWFDRTNYYETLKASDDNLAFAIKLEADRMINSFIRAEDLKSEMTVVRNEFEMRENDPFGVLRQEVMHTAYLWHAYGRATLGNQSDIERVPIHALKAFYQKYYQPDNAVLIVAGNFNPEHAFNLIKNSFGTIKKPERVLENTYTVEPAQDGPRHINVHRVGDVAATMVAYHIPASTHPDYTACMALSEMLSDEPDGLLYAKLVKSALASTVYGWTFPLAEPGLMFFFAHAAKNDAIEKIRTTMNNELEKNIAGALTNESLERIKARLLNQYKLAAADTATLGIRLSEAIAVGDWRLYFLARQEIENLKLDKVKEVAAKYLIESNRTTGDFIPTKDPKRIAIAPAPSIDNVLATLKASDAVSAGEKFEVSLSNIAQRSEIVALSPSIKLWSLPKKSRADEVKVSFTFKIGNEQSLKGHGAELDLLADMLMRGTKSLSFTQLKDKLDKLQSAISVGMQDLATVGVSIVSDKKHIVEVIDLVADVLKNPRFDKEQFAIAQREALKSLTINLSSPQALARNKIEKIINPWPKGSIHYVQTIEEVLQDVRSANVGKIQRLHKQLYGASRVNVAAVGSFEPTSLKKALMDNFGDWKPQVSFVRVEKPFKAALEENVTISVKDKKMAVVAFATNLEVKDDMPDYVMLRFANYVLGETWTSRLWVRLREKEGLSYGVGSSLMASSYDKRAYFSARAICAPENADKAQKSMMEEFTAWRDNFSLADVEAEKKAFKEDFESDLAKDDFLVSMFLGNLEVDRSLAFQENFMKQIAALKVDDIKTSLKTYFGSKNLAQIKAGDFAKNGG